MKSVLWLWNNPNNDDFWVYCLNSLLNVSLTTIKINKPLSSEHCCHKKESSQPQTELQKYIDTQDLGMLIKHCKSKLDDVLICMNRLKNHYRSLVYAKKQLNKGLNSLKITIFGKFAKGFMWQNGQKWLIWQMKFKMLTAKLIQFG